MNVHQLKVACWGWWYVMCVNLWLNSMKFLDSCGQLKADIDKDSATDSRKSSATFRLESVVAVGCQWGSGDSKDGDVRHHGKHGELQHLRQSIATCVTFSACYCLFRSWMCAAQPLLLTSQQTQHSLELAQFWAVTQRWIHTVWTFKEGITVQHRMIMDDRW